MKAVLISIHPKYCELIASGEKTVEVRKTKPKLETPFKCYIYCTINGDLLTATNGIVSKPNEILLNLKEDNDIQELNGKVIGEFVCDDIDEIAVFNGLLYCVKNSQANKLKQMCLTIEEIKAYLGGKNLGYNWHISDLKIYDKPRELSDFYTWKKCNSCRDTGYESTACCYDEDCRVPAAITRPTQSWCYVEEIEK